MNRAMQKGFTLVELSIVLVILGLLVGGVLSGQSLIRAAELRSVSSEYQRYMAATHSFRDKYFALPGDFREATRFWRRMNSNADCVANFSAAATGTQGTCDGNADGLLQSAAGNGQSGEIFQFWRQLANAGLVEGTYSGVAGSSGTAQANDTNVPKSKLPKATWLPLNFSALTGHGGIFDRGELGAGFQVGANRSDGGGNRTGVLKPEEAWNIDTKLDDGKPAQGNILSRVDETLYTFPDCTTATASSQLNAEYAVSKTSTACTLNIRMGI